MAHDDRDRVRTAHQALKGRDGDLGRAEEIDGEGHQVRTDLEQQVDTRAQGEDADNMLALWKRRGKRAFDAEADDG